MEGDISNSVTLKGVIWTFRGHPSMVEVCGVVRLDVRRCGRSLLQTVQDLGIEGRSHLVDYLALPAFPVLATPLDGVLDSHL